MTRTETKGERKRTTATKQNTSNSSYFNSGRSYPTNSFLGHLTVCYFQKVLYSVFPLFRNVNWN